jgi:hypothetical protein
MTVLSHVSFSRPALRRRALLLLGAVTATAHAGGSGDYADTIHCRDEPVYPGSIIKNFHQAMAACVADTNRFKSEAKHNEKRTITTSCGVYKEPDIFPNANAAGDTHVNGMVSADYYIENLDPAAKGYHSDGTWLYYFQCLQSP